MPKATKKALLVLDMVKVYVEGVHPLIRVSNRAKLISNIKGVIGTAREINIPVIYVSSAFRRDDPIMRIIGHRKQAMKGGKNAEIINELKPMKSDFKVEKRGYDAFWNSRLNSLLKKLKVSDLYLIGEQTDCCIRQTGITAAHLGYKVYVIEDCCDTARPMGQKSTLYFIERCVGETIKSKELRW